MTDPITDMFNRIRNAELVVKPEIEVPFSNIKSSIAEILEKNNLIEKVEKTRQSGKRMFKITLKYSESQENKNEKIPAISGVKMISKPGRRIYVSAREIKPVRNGCGIAIISTSKGLMTGKEARKQRLGGEMICEIW